MKDKKKKSKLRYLPRDIVWAIGYTLGWLVFRPKNYYISEEAKKKIKGGSLIISNHIGFVDPVYLMMAMGYRRQHFIATKEFFFQQIQKIRIRKDISLHLYRSRQRRYCYHKNCGQRT